MITLPGYHTLSIFRRLTAEQHYTLGLDFKGSNEIEKCPIKNDKKREIGWMYTYKENKGIRWLTLAFTINERITVYGVKAIITPKVLLNKDYLAAATEDDIQNFKSLFNIEARKISHILGDIDSYSMSRSDYCLNFNLEELGISCSPEKMMILIKRGNIPKHFKERTEYSEVSKRQKTNKESFYLESDSVTVNCYDKYTQLMNDEKHPCLNREDAKGIIRFEVQCMYRKLYSMAKTKINKSDISESSNEMELSDLYDALISRSRVAIPIDAMLSDDIAADVIHKYFYKVIRGGDYYSLEIARNMIQSEDCHQKKKDRLISALTLTNLCRSIHKAIITLEGTELQAFKRSLKDLEQLRINPVTIPREWGIEHVPNLLDTYYSKLYDVHKREIYEQCERDILNDYIKDCRKNGKVLG